MPLQLTEEERERYRGYVHMEAFWLGWDDYENGKMYEYSGVIGQAYDRGQECGMRRLMARFRKEREEEQKSIETERENPANDCTLHGLDDHGFR
jgi:hypothetical protein